MRNVARVSRLAQEKDPEVLHRAIELLENHNRALTAKIKELLAELAKARGDSTYQQLRLAALEKQLAKLTKQVFGPSSEQRTTDGAPADGSSEGEGKKEKKKKTGHGPTEQPKLPVVDVEHKLDDADKTCPKCGGDLKEMAGKYEDHEEIDVLPLRFVLKRHRRQKYSCRCGGCIETAPGPDKLCPGGRYSIAFAIHVAISKYCDHMPLERQVRMMARDGLVVTSQTLWDQIEQLAWLVESVMPRLRAFVLEHSVVGADETTWELFGKKPGQSKSWFVWVLRVEHGVYYAIRGGRSFKTAESLLMSFAGVLMCDGYAAYQSLSRAYPRVVLAHCWAHVRREFVEIEKSFPKPCGEILDLIGKLYLIERRCPQGPEGDEERRMLRDQESRPVIDEIIEWVYRTTPKCLPESGLHKAIGYMVNMWPGLVLFLDDPEIPLDNNGTERAARAPVIGRKNHYGSHSLRGTEVAATFYSLVESAKLNGLEPRFYLRVATRAGLRRETVPLPHEVKAMLAAGKLDPNDFEDHTEGIVRAALAAARAAATADQGDAAHLTGC
ncbi:IS66 family transposase [Sorangium sp. So ce1024]|uniref:IS66 family transposase n=1 Tax=Sorangium sp. So ce1024 TaxID=3133327 RepID=UPI003F068525